jgi:hypothetical protein
VIRDAITVSVEYLLFVRDTVSVIIVIKVVRNAVVVVVIILNIRNTIVIRIW